MGDFMEFSLEANKLIEKFRIITLVFSILLLIFDKNQANSFWSNFFVIICFIISNILLIYFHKDMTITENKIIALLVIEFLGIMTVLSYSGVWYSYYFWMLLNPVITCEIKLKDKKRKSFVILIMVVSCILFLMSGRGSVGNIFNNVNVIFGFFITVIFSSMISKVLHKQERIRGYLQKNIQINKEIITNIINSIELTERLSTVENYEEMVTVMIEFFDLGSAKGKSFFAIKKEDREILLNGKNLQGKSENIKMLIQKDDSSKEITQTKISNDIVLMYNSMEYRGVYSYFGILVPNQYEIMEIGKQQLVFIQKIYKIILSKIKLQELRKELLISEEQNRIAEEMHDNVNQQIFSISCLAFNLKQKIENEKYSNDVIVKMSSQLYDSLKTINKDIKDIVYRMSLEKDNKENLIVNFDKYLDELTFIYNVKINHNISKSLINFNIDIKNTILRILSESISNAVRHGKAKNIDIKIYVEDRIVNLEINDDGSGFDINKLDLKKRGLGIQNMKKLSELNKGTFEILSQINKGTCIKIKLSME